MTAKQQREIVIEFEKVQLIRKRAKTTLAFCGSCGGEADFVELQAAARLFDTSDGDLATFVASNAVHIDLDTKICIPSLLSVMHERNNVHEVKLIDTPAVSPTVNNTEAQVGAFGGTLGNLTIHGQDAEGGEQL